MCLSTAPKVETLFERSYEQRARIERKLSGWRRGLAGAFIGGGLL